MGGTVPFHEALAARLSLIRPSENDIKNCLINHPFRLTPGIDEVVSRLQAKGVHVYLVSGGFRQARLRSTNID